MDDAERRAAFQAALNNEYFVLQSARGSTVAESGTRASLYVLSLSSTLVAIGFVARSGSAVGPFLAVVLPTLFVLGLFTVVRLVDTGVDNLRCLRSMARIRRYYADLAPEGSQLFSVDKAVASTAVRRRRVAGASTIATMIAVVNAVVGSTAVALLVAHVRGGFDRGLGLPVGVGASVGVILVGAFLLYQDRRYNSLAPIAPEEDV
jgi:hypothetical protein